jgi:diacylglycerol kinase (ATP)
MRVTLIHNPRAGANEQDSGDELLSFVRAAGHTVTCQATKGDGWEEALDDPGDLVAVAGGDGTVGAVAVRLVGRHVPIAVLPVGTANNIAKALGLADTTLERLIGGWPTARRIAFDTGVVHGPYGAIRFIEGVGVGLLARAITELDAKAEVAFGRVDIREEKMSSGLKRLRELLGTCPANELKITVDGQDLSGAYVLLEVMNIPHIGPSLHFAPDADPCDGLLDVVLLTDAQRDKLGDYLASCLEGDSQPMQCTVIRGRHLQLECDGADIHIDDKVWPAHGSTSSESPILLDLSAESHSVDFFVVDGDRTAPHRDGSRGRTR